MTVLEVSILSLSDMRSAARPSSPVSCTECSRRVIGVVERGRPSAAASVGALRVYKLFVVAYKCQRTSRGCSTPEIQGSNSKCKREASNVKTHGKTQTVGVVSGLLGSDEHATGFNTKIHWNSHFGKFNARGPNP